MEQGGQRILLLVSEQGVLIGIVTDTDIRRWMVGKRDLSAAISKAAKLTPIVIKEREYSSELARNLMMKNRIESVPVVDSAGRPISIVFWFEVFGDEVPSFRKIDAPVFIMAGGRGTRLDPYTRVFPKPLIPVGEKAMIEHIMDHFALFGCSDFTLSLGYKASLMRAYFSEPKEGMNISFVEESSPLGTAGSLSLLKNEIKKTFFLTNCDVLIKVDLKNALSFHQESSNVITLVGSPKRLEIPYGVLEVDGSMALKGIDEKPQFDFLISTGMYLIEPEVLKRIPKNTQIDMPDVIRAEIARGSKVGVHSIPESSWLDVGQRKDFENTGRTLTLKQAA